MHTVNSLQSYLTSCYPWQIADCTLDYVVQKSSLTTNINANCDQYQFHMINSSFYQIARRISQNTQPKSPCCLCIFCCTVTATQELFTSILSHRTYINARFCVYVCAFCVPFFVSLDIIRISHPYLNKGVSELLEVFVSAEAAVFGLTALLKWVNQQKIE